MPKKKQKVVKDEYINSFFIPKETIETMNELNYKTHQDKREHGMALCFSPDKRVVPGKESIGDFDSIDVPETCKRKDDKYLGSFHTHPAPSETKFSAMDLFSSCDKRSKIDCVGMNKEGEIQCFIKRKQNESCQDDAKPLVDVEDTYKYLNPEDMDIVKEALLGAVDNFTDDRFKNKKIL